MNLQSLVTHFSICGLFTLNCIENMKQRLLLVGSFIFFTLASIGQPIFEAPRCGADMFQQILRKDPLYASNENVMNEKIRAWVLQAAGQKTISISVNNVGNNNVVVAPTSVPVVTVPVVFHIVNQNAAAITDQMIIDAVAELNKAFAHLGVYGTDPKGVDTRIQFCLATRTPDGGKTNGIDRINSYYQNIDVDLEAGKLGVLSNWNPSKYANIWLVNSIQGEIQPSVFECGKWERMGYGGYASAGGGLVVSSLSTPLVAHEMGHYLSLLHTFQGTNCANNDCTTDGDLVCDTPPDRSIKSSPCSSPENSCNTDTISGPFTVDEPDNISNFMDYGSPCPSVFTQGQANRMMAFLNVFNGGSLLTSDGCSAPCADNVAASFNFDANPHPVAGSTVNFVNTSVGALTYEWYVNGTLVSTATNYANSFAATGTYKVVLKGVTAGASCFSTYTANVIVNCGVDARFSPDKRIIASAAGVYKDPVHFLNKSYGATTYNWYVSDELGTNEQMVSTSNDLLYDFLKPGSYTIRLVASAGACISNSPTYTLQVNNPAADGQINIYSVNCYKNDSVRVVFGVRNNGYDTIPAGVSVNFYDRYPSVPGPIKMLNSFVTDQMILGKCEKVYTHIVKAPRLNVDSISLVFDEENSVSELNEGNNRTNRKGFRFRLFVIPSDTTVFVNTTLVIKDSSAPDKLASIKWSSSKGLLSCTTCSNPVLSVIDTTLVKANAISVFGCDDSTFATINVFPVDISINNLMVRCYKNDSLQITSTVCLDNQYTSLYQPTQIRYFDSDSTLPTSKFLGTGWILASTSFAGNCATITHIVRNQNVTSVVAYVNSGLTPFENNTANNKTSVSYVPFSIRFNPTQIDVYRGDPTTLQPINSGDKATTIVWTPSKGLSCSNCLTPVLTTNTNTLLKIVGTTALFCKDSATLQVNAYHRSHIALPNAFSPNGDGLNDVFYVIAGKDVKQVKQFQVFNRWGQKMFERTNGKTNDISFGWNGYYNGQLVAQGTYVYQIVIELLTGELEIHKGNISVIR
jgi:gliding motility-associated-like protein